MAGGQRIADAAQRARRACTICCQPANLRRTLPIAIVVGVALTLINQLDVFVRGEETALTWAKVGLNFVVPFCVSNLGLLAGTSLAGRAEGQVSSASRRAARRAEP